MRRDERVTDEMACPDCGRPKAKTAGDAARGDCPKWWAIRDEMAEKDCARHAAQPRMSRDLLGKIIDDVFDGAIEDASVIEDIYASIVRHSALSAALSEQTLPVGEQWCAFEDGHQHTSWYPDGYGDRAGWEALAKRNPVKYQIVTRPLYTHPPHSSLVDNSHTSEEVVERKYGLGDRVTKKAGSSWTGHVVGFYSTSLTPIGYAVESENEPGSVQIYPEAALSSLRPAEVGSATETSGTGGGE